MVKHVKVIHFQIKGFLPSKTTNRCNAFPFGSHFLQQCIRIDKMHMRGHKDEDCKKKYDANNDHDLDGVNTQIAEQTFSKTNLFRNVKSMNETHF